MHGAEGDGGKGRNHKGAGEGSTYQNIIQNAWI